MASASQPVPGGRQPSSAIEGGNDRDAVIDAISLSHAVTLAGLFRTRVERSPQHTAYHFYDEARQCWSSLTWAEMARQVARWQQAMQREGLQPGERVAVMLRNCPQWVMFDQAALGLGLVVVPLYTNDRPDNVAYILDDCQARLLLIEGREQWQALQGVAGELSGVRRIVTLDAMRQPLGDDRQQALATWLPDIPEAVDLHDDSRPGDVASIVYTSGTTGRPKGVMLSHHNILWNADSALARVAVSSQDVFLSFLPLSHTLERTIGYYLAMMAGASVAYARSIPLLAEDIVTIRPTVLISVPRIFERILSKMKLQLQDKPWVMSRMFHAAVDCGWRAFEYHQGRSDQVPGPARRKLLDFLVGRRLRRQLGGRLRVAVCGGAPLSPEVARVFIGLGVPIVQGYGMTETSPVISANALEHNRPASVGPPLRDVQVRVADNHELVVKSPGVMMGYWNKPEATAEIIDREGWLHTGDTARLEDGFIHITGRLKEIIVLSNGEKIPPADMELAITQDPLFEQAMVVGEGRPYLGALLVLERGQWLKFARQHGIDGDDPQVLGDDHVLQLTLDRVTEQIRGFPGYAQIRRIALLDEPWTVDSGLMTPTLKLRRRQILDRHAETVSALYEGH